MADWIFELIVSIVCEAIYSALEWIFSSTPRPVVRAHAQRLPVQTNWLQVEIHGENFTNESITLQTMIVRKPLSIRLLDWSAGTQHNVTTGDDSVLFPLPVQLAKRKLKPHVHMQPHGTPPRAGHPASEIRYRFFIYMQEPGKTGRIALSIKGTRSHRGKHRRFRIPVKVQMAD